MLQQMTALAGSCTSIVFLALISDHKGSATGHYQKWQWKGRPGLKEEPPWLDLVVKIPRNTGEAPVISCGHPSSLTLVAAVAYIDRAG